MAAVEVKNSPLNYDGSLTHEYSFDAGTSADNKGSANGVDTTMSYTTVGQVSAAFGQKATFGGAGYITFSAKLLPAPGNACTFNVWLKSTNTSAYQVVTDDSNGDGSKIGTWIATAQTSGVFYVENENNNLTRAFSFGGATNVCDGNWHMCTYTWTGTTAANGVKLYVDGLQDAQATANNTGSSPQSFNTRIGSGASTVSSLFTGSMDDPTYWTRVLTPAEISNLYKGFPLGNFLPFM